MRTPVMRLKTVTRPTATGFNISLGAAATFMSTAETSSTGVVGLGTLCITRPSLSDQGEGQGVA